jgi:ribosomal protein S18 acetylase RimI-like enzyme
MSITETLNTITAENYVLPAPDVTLNVSELTKAEENEVMAFLAERPIHTVCMVGMIRDNGVVSEHNRGTFYGCRNSEGRLEGVALIGHATLVETRTRGAMRELALTAQIHDRLHMIMAEQDKVEDFWSHYSDEGQQMRHACREVLFELKRSVFYGNRVDGLRQATLADLDLVAPVHAAMAEAESGINPLNVDPTGFLGRCSRRIEKGRVWVVVEDDQLIFKADVQAESAEVIYLEGVYVSPQYRGTGLARRCLTQLCDALVTPSRSVCVLVNEENEAAQVYYRMCGFRKVSNYDTIFLSRPALVGSVN